MAGWLRRRWCTLAFLAGLVATEAVAWSLPAGRRAGLQAWASTNVVNLRHHPVAALALSAFLPDSYPGIWPVLMAMGLFSAERLLGSARAALCCGLAQLLGTLVSEGIVAYRVHAGGLPGSALSQLDIGPSYVVVAALTVAVLAGSWPRRAVALAGLAALWPSLFDGLSHLDVAPVGHAVSVAVAATAAATVRRRRPAGAPARDAAGAPPPA